MAIKRFFWDFVRWDGEVDRGGFIWRYAVTRWVLMMLGHAAIPLVVEAVGPDAAMPLLVAAGAPVGALLSWGLILRRLRSIGVQKLFPSFAVGDVCLVVCYACGAELLAGVCGVWLLLILLGCLTCPAKDAH